MGRYRKTIILVTVMLVLIALLAGVVLIKQNVSNNNENPDNTDDNEPIILYSMTINRIDTFSIKNAYGEFVFKLNDEGEWYMYSDPAFEIDQTVVQNLVALYASPVADKLIEENPKKLTDYTLQNPTRVTLTQRNGESTTLLIGGPTATKQGFYVMVDGETSVYTLSVASSMFALTNTKNVVIRRDIIPTDVTKFDKFRLERDGEVIIDAYGGTANADGSRAWYMIEPITASVEGSNLGVLLTKLTEASILGYEAENPSDEDMEACGLSSPTHRISFEADGSTTTLLLGYEKTKNEEIYAYWAEKDYVITLDPSKLDFLDVSLDQMVSAYAYITSINNVDKIEYTDTKGTVAGELYTDEYDKANDKFYIAGEEITTKDAYGRNYFRAFYQALIGLAMDEMDMTATPELVNPEATVKYTLKPGVKTNAVGEVLTNGDNIVTVELVTKDENYYYIFKDGEYTKMIIAKSELTDKGSPRAVYEAMQTEKIE